MPIVQTFHESDVFSKGTKRREISSTDSNFLKNQGLGAQAGEFCHPRSARHGPHRFGRQADRIPSRVIPAGIDLELFRPKRKAWHASGGIGPGECLIFFPGDPATRASATIWPTTVSSGLPTTSPRPACSPAAASITGACLMAQCRRCDPQPNRLRSLADHRQGSAGLERPLVMTDVGDVRECYAGLPGVLLPAEADDIAEKLAGALDVTSPYGGRQRVETWGWDWTRSPNESWPCIRK